MLDFSSAYNELREKLLEQRGVNIYPGSVANDLFLVPLAYTQTKLEHLITFFSLLQSADGILRLRANPELARNIIEALNITEAEFIDLLSFYVDKLAANFGLTRQPPIRASGVVTLYAMVEPPPDRTVMAGTVIGSTIVETKYIVTTNVSFIAKTFRDGFWELDVPVEATIAGTRGNVQAGAIDVSPIPEFTGAINREAFTNGIDEETDANLLIRLKDVITGTGIATKDGLRNLILKSNIVTDAYIVPVGSPLMFRNRFGSTIDVYVVSEKLETATHPITPSAIHQTLIPVHRPVTSMAPLAGVTFSQDVDERLFAGSVQSGDRFTVAPNTTGTITYTFNSNINTLQSLLNIDQNLILNTSILVKEAVRVLIDIVLFYTVKPLFYKTEINPIIIRNIYDYVNNLRLGNSLSQSDIIGIVENVRGVNKVTTPLTRFNRSNVLTPAHVSELTVNNIEYIRINTLSVF